MYVNCADRNVSASDTALDARHNTRWTVFWRWFGDAIVRRLSSPITDIAHVIQLSVAPVFLISGIAALLSVLSGRLARLVDRARVLEAQAAKSGDETPAPVHEELSVLSRR